MFAWMAWTWQTGVFFGVIALAFAILTLLAIFWPQPPRQGILGFPTQRGDRFFVSLIGAAFIFVLWMRFDGGALWYPLGLSVIFGATMFRFA